MSLNSLYEIREKREKPQVGEAPRLPAHRRQGEQREKLPSPPLLSFFSYLVHPAGGRKSDR